MMETERWLGLRKLLLVFTALSGSRGLEVSIPQTEYEVARGDDVTLTCSFVPARPDFPLLVLTWEALPDNSNDKMIPVATFYSTGQVDIAPPYEGRAVLSTDIAEQKSTLLLTKVSMTENRSFQCSVMIPNDDEGTTVAVTSLLVLVAPTKPICEMQGSAEYWSDIVLTCVSEEGSPEPTYAWKSYSVKNVPREFPPRTTEKDGVLSLFNVSMETSGFYVCQSTNRIGSASYNFTLFVTPPSMNIGATAGIIGGVLAAFLLLGIIIYCCCRRKKGKKDKNAQGSPEVVEFHDKPTSKGNGQDWDDEKPHNQTEPHIEAAHQTEERGEKDGSHQDQYNDYTAGATDHRNRYEDDRHSDDSRKERRDGNTSDVDDRRDRYGGSRDRLDDRRDGHGGSRDRLDDRRDGHGGSRDRLDDRRDGLDDRRDRYGGSRDRLDDQRDRNGGSRDRLDDRRDGYGGSRDRLDDRHDRSVGSRDRLDYNHGRYGEP